MSRWDYGRLRAACAAEGTTVYSLIRWLLEEWLEEYSNAQETGATEAQLLLFFGGG